MSRGRLEGYSRRGTQYCYCGRKIGAPDHNRTHCLTFLQDPSPGRGAPVLWSIPMRLYQSSEPAGISKDLERYLDFWCGRYRRAMDDLLYRFPHHYYAYRAMVHDGERAATIAVWMDTTPGAVRQWKRRGLAFMRERVGDAREWEQRPAGRLPLDQNYEPSAAAHRAITEELRGLNARKVAVA